MTIRMLTMEVDSEGTHGVMSDDQGHHFVVLITKDPAGGGFHISPVEQCGTYAEASLRASHLNQH